MNKRKKNIFFSIVLYKHSYEDIKELLISIKNIEIKLREIFKIHCIISDNSNNDSIKSSFENNLNLVKQFYYTFHGRNLGYGKAHNFNLLKKSLIEENHPDDIYIIVNPDIVFESENLKKILFWYEKSKKVSCTAPLIYNNNKIIQYSAKKNPTFLSLLLGRLYFLQRIKIFKKYVFWHTNQNLNYKKDIINSSYLSGCFLITKRKYFETCNGFSAEYFLHLEDADLVRKLSKYGMTIHNPISEITHFWARGSHKSISQMISLIKSYFIYIGKWGFKLW